MEELNVFFTNLYFNSHTQLGASTVDPAIYQSVILVTRQPVKRSPCHVPCEISTAHPVTRAVSETCFSPCPTTGQEKGNGHTHPQPCRQERPELSPTLQSCLPHSRRPPCCKPVHTRRHSGASPWQSPAPSEGGYFLTGGLGSWFPSGAAASPIQLHILGFPPGILGVPPEYSLPCSRIPKHQIIYWALTVCWALWPISVHLPPFSFDKWGDVTQKDRNRTWT
jgi:hypothetical protein